jgi:hypothetical protein
VESHRTGLSLQWISGCIMLYVWSAGVLRCACERVDEIGSAREWDTPN